MAIALGVLKTAKASIVAGAAYQPMVSISQGVKTLLQLSFCNLEAIMFRPWTA
jgi:hypothetical protein